MVVIRDNLRLLTGPPCIRLSALPSVRMRATRGRILRTSICRKAHSERPISESVTVLCEARHLRAGGARRVHLTIAAPFRRLSLRALRAVSNAARHGRRTVKVFDKVGGERRIVFSVSYPLNQIYAPDLLATAKVIRSKFGRGIIKNRAIAAVF